MKPEDSFFYKLGSEEGSNFKEFNSKTIGFILVIILVFFLFHCTTAGMVCVNRYYRDPAFLQSTEDTPG